MADDIAENLERGATVESSQPRPSRSNMLSTGCTLLNLACTGNAFGGFLKGQYYLIVGDSTSGKTFLSMSCLAEATLNRRFADYRFIYDNVEDGCHIDLEGLFNKAVAERIEPPVEMDDGLPLYSSTVEEFYYNVDDAIADGRPFIYILDSMDGLSSDPEGDKFDEDKKAFRKGIDAKGSYGDGKAKHNSTHLRTVLRGLRDSGSILIIIAQTRDNLGFGAKFNPKTRSGGRSLRFYANTEIWSSVKGQITKTVKGKLRPVGVRVKLDVKKNRMTGVTPVVETSIYPSHGIDDVGTCVDYLIDEGWWTKKKQSIDAREFEMVAARGKIIQHIEENGLLNNLRALVGKCWKEIEDASALKRKNRYTQ